MSEISGAIKKPYALSITLQGLPKMSNQLLRGHWRIKHAHAMKWKLAVSLASHMKRPPEPLMRALVSIVRHSSTCPDFDGLVSAGKALIDGLVECGVLAGDSMAHIGQPSYTWEKCGPKKGHVVLEVRELTKETKCNL